MYAIVVGGGKVGYYLAKTLLSEGHEVLVIEKDRKKSERIAEELGSIVLRGDGCEATTLAEVGTSRADVIVAVTGDDEDNLVICQMAKKKFNVGRTIARINNPKNEHIFKLLGIDATVSSTNVIMSQIEQEIPQQALVHLLKLRHAEVEIVEVVVGEGSPIAGKQLRSIALPPECAISIVVRDEKLIIPTGETVLRLGDEVIALTKVEQEASLRRALLG
jgi:trk system potassium uptake protein TrkA